jgi:hypothetical protein
MAIKYDVYFENYDFSRDFCERFDTEEEAEEYIDRWSWEETQEAGFLIEEVED